MKSNPSAQLLSILEWICRLAVAGLFIYAAYPKLMDPTHFAKAIANYRVVLPVIGQDYVYPAAIFLPALELLTGIGILIPRTKYAASVIITLLLSLFTVLIVQAVLRGFNIDCGCFGSSELSATKASRVGWMRVLQNLGWIAAAGFVWWRSVRRRSTYRL